MKNNKSAYGEKLKAKKKLYYEVVKVKVEKHNLPTQQTVHYSLTRFILDPS
jgi:hypothetical protein